MAKATHILLDAGADATNQYALRALSHFHRDFADTAKLLAACSENIKEPEGN